MVEASRLGRRHRVTHILRKGNFLDPGDVVGPGVPESLPAHHDREPRNRLGLARWLVDPRNPLTARVAVNRYWAQIFGVGLVETEEDFGTQGEPPSHPRLLDWLAVQYRESGWNTKQLVAADCHLGDLPSVVEGQPRAAGERPAKPLVGACRSGSPPEAEMVRDQAAGLERPFERPRSVS